MTGGSSNKSRDELRPPKGKGSVSGEAEHVPPQEQVEAAAEESLLPVSSLEEESLSEDEVRGEATIDEVAARLVEPAEVKPEEAQERIRKLTGENANLFDQLLRKQAEFENFRKRTEKEKTEFMRYANFEIVRSMLPILDGFERALQMETPRELEGFKKGMALVYKQFFDGLQKAGLKPIEAVGHKFDPNFHQAMVHEERDDLDDNVVIEEYQRGYLFQGRLLRAAMVKVAMGRKAPSGREEPLEDPTVQ